MMIFADTLNAYKWVVSTLQLFSYTDYLFVRCFEKQQQQKQTNHFALKFASLRCVLLITPPPPPQ